MGVYIHNIPPYRSMHMYPPLKRYGNHRRDFKHQKYESSAKLANYIWKSSN